MRELLETTTNSGIGFDGYMLVHDFEDIGHCRKSVSGWLLHEDIDDLPMVLMQIEDITDKSQYGDNR